METLQSILDRNAAWARKRVAEDPAFFRRLVAQQAPEYLWIGCSDSRVPANEIVDLAPGELFVHRNIANVVSPADHNCQSVIEFAVHVLRIKHIMVVGHYGCSGVRSALEGRSIGQYSDYWLEHVRAVARRHESLLAEVDTPARRASFLCELNVLEQALNVCASPAVLAAWERGQELTVHGWVYRLGDGRIRHLDFGVNSPQDAAALRDTALRSILGERRKYYGKS
jgi:carbonic anhydrase